MNVCLEEEKSVEPHHHPDSMVLHTLLWRFGGFQNESSSSSIHPLKDLKKKFKIELFKPKFATYMPQVVYLHQHLSILLPILLLQIQLLLLQHLSCGEVFSGLHQLVNHSFWFR